MNIEEIMRPYYEAKEEIRREIQTKKAENEIKVEQLSLEKNRLKLRLERLIDRKQSEIEDYILSIDAREYSYNPNYLVTKKRELELEYEKAEQSIKEQIDGIDKELELINQENYSNLLYDKKIPGIREVARQEAARLAMQLELEVESKTLELQLVDLDIKALRNKFYSWQMDEAMVELQPYFQTRDKILKEIEGLKDLIERVKEESNLLYNDDELNEFLRGNIVNLEVIESNIEQPIEKVEVTQADFIKEEEQKTIELEQEENLVEEIDFGAPIPSNEEEIEDLEEVRQPLEPKDEDAIDDNSVEFENINEMLETIFADVMACAKKLRTVKLDGNTLQSKDFGKTDYEVAGDLEINQEKIELPNGVYLNKKDISNALNNYKKEAKGRTFKVKGFDSVISVTSQMIRNVKKSLRDCSIIKLLTERKLSEYDIKRVYGKEKAANYYNEVELGSIETKISSGDYINLNEFVAKLGITFAEKSQSWIEKLRQKISEKINKNVDPVTMWEEPENENVKTR